MQGGGSGDAGKVKDDEGEQTTVNDTAGAHPIRHLMTSSPHPTLDGQLAPSDAQPSAHPSHPCSLFKTFDQDESTPRMRGVYVIFARCAASLEPSPDVLSLQELYPTRCAHVAFVGRVVSPRRSPVAVFEG